MDLETAKEITESPLVEKYIEAIDTDAQHALDEMEDNLYEMDDFPSKYTAEYKADGKALDKAWGEFNEQWNLVCYGKAKDGRAAMSAYKRYVITLEVLEAQNVRFGAYVEADVAGMAALFLAILISAIKAIRKRCKELYDELTALQKLLTKAKRDVKGAELQREINVAITVISLCIPAVGLGAGIAIAATTFTVQMVVDASLGPGSPGVIGVANSAAGDCIGLPKQVKPKFAKLGGAASGIISWKLDSDEIGDAKAIVAEIQKRLKSVQKSIKTLEKYLSSDIGDLEKHQKNFEKALKEAKAAEGKFVSHQNQRLALLRELKDLK